MRPSYARSGPWLARALDDRYHQANPSVARITGTTTTSMIAVELISRSRSADAIGPCGSSTPVWRQEETSTAAQTTSERRKLERRAVAAGRCGASGVAYGQTCMQPPVQRAASKMPLESRQILNR